MTDFVDSYFSFAIQLLQDVLRDSGGAIRQAAERIANTIEHDGTLLLYGSGHSALIAKDGAYRAGGLAPALALDDAIDGDAERMEGFARYIAGRYDLHAGDVMIIISNSGINAVPIEMAMIAKAAGLTTVGITSFTHSKSVPTRHSSGKRLYEVVDIAIDTHSAPGDAALEIPRTAFRTGATSTLIGSAIVQAITVRTVQILVERGHQPPIWVSANLPQGDEHNNQLLQRYQPRLVRHQMAVLPIWGGSKHK